MSAVFKIVTWNINGLRSLGGLVEWRKIFTDFDADLVCFQETKISRANVEEWMSSIEDYTSYFTFPKGQLQTSGYSGVATYCRESSEIRPDAAEVSLLYDTTELFDPLDENEEDELFLKFWNTEDLRNVSWKLVDSEGRTVVTRHRFRFDSDDKALVRHLYVFNVYCPRRDCTRAEREEYQLRFYHLLTKRASQLMSASSTNHVILLGDFNTAHQEIDVADDHEFGYVDTRGRKWINHLLNLKIASPQGDRHMVDSFRHLNPTASDAFTCWNTLFNLRQTNFGSRIDYIIVDDDLAQCLEYCSPKSDYFGSDHCPVEAHFKGLRFIKSDRYSAHCTKMWPEFGGTKQVSIRQFFTTKTIASEGNCTNKSNSSDTNRKRTGQMNLLGFVKKIPKTSTSEKTQPSEELVSSQDSIGSFLEEQPKVKPVENQSSAEWKRLFNAKPVPVCTGHNLTCVRRKVKKAGPTQGKEFYCCPKTAIKPEGHPETRCSFFQWVNQKASKDKNN